jgi:hypothetical protein
MGFIGASIWGIAALIITLTIFKVKGITKDNVNEAFKIN